MRTEEVFMDFDENNEPVLSVKGVKGKACEALTEPLERKLGKVTSKQRTREYNEVERGDNRGIPNRR
jgi:hypothetical protein